MKVTDTLRAGLALARLPADDVRAQSRRICLQAFFIMHDSLTTETDQDTSLEQAIDFALRAIRSSSG